MTTFPIIDDPVLAAIDIGTNSTKMTVAKVAPAGATTVLFERSEVNRLGEGVDASKTLKPEAIRRTLDAIVRFAAEAREAGAGVVLGAGTSALRDAVNGQDLIEGAHREAGIEVEVITGDREAELAYAAVRSDKSLGLDPEHSLVVFDIGGGSTELIVGGKPGVQRHSSLNIGAVRLTERFVKSDPPSDVELHEIEAFVRQALGTFAPPEGPTAIVGIGGTAVNIGSVIRARQSTSGQSEDLHGTVVTLADVRSASELFRGVPLSERRNIRGLEPARADVIIAGAAILDLLLAHFAAQAFTVSTRGLRYGLLADYVARNRG